MKTARACHPIGERRVPYKDIEARRKHRREYHYRNLERSRAWNRESYRRCIEKTKEAHKRYWKAHPEKRKEYKAKRKSTPQGKIDASMSRLINLALKGNKAGWHWETLVGYTVDELKQCLQERFTKGMTWGKFLKGEIHIDHKVPRSYFTYTTSDDPQFKECWALHNLQPLWAKDNIAKGNRGFQLPLILGRQGE
jgi:hypothetical protein